MSKTTRKYYKKKAPVKVVTIKKTPAKPRRQASSSSSSAQHHSMRKYIPDGSFSSAGKLAGNFLAGPIGGTIGSKLGQLASQIVGFGDYQIEGNSLMEGGLSPPEIVNSVNRGGIIVRHREYLGDITASIPFVVQTYPIQPGINASFPWLSQIASAFEEYEFRGLIYEFKSLSSDAVLSSATSSALGYVAMATQYNAASQPFLDKKALENYEYANSNKPSCSFIHPVECKRRLNVDTHLYVRTGAVPNGEDQKTYDVGELNIAVGGCQASTGILGELWCTYEIELFHPKYTINSGVLADHWFNTAVVNGSSQLGGVRVRQAGSTLGLTMTASVINFPTNIVDGYYLCNFLWVATPTVTIAAPNFAYTNATALTVYVGETSNFTQGPQNGVTLTNSLIVNILLRVNSSGAAITLTGGTVPASSVDIIISETALFQG